MLNLQLPSNYVSNKSHHFLPNLITLSDKWFISILISIINLCFNVHTNGNENTITPFTTARVHNSDDEIKALYKMNLYTNI